MNSVYILKFNEKFLAIDKYGKSYYTENINLAFKSYSKLGLKHLSNIKKRYRNFKKYKGSENA
jgi:hypothetical protein